MIQQMYFLIILIILLQQPTMDRQPQAYTVEQRKINGKSFMVPNYNLFGCEKYMLPKLDNAPVHHTFYEVKELENLYEQKGVNKEQLNFNLEKQVQLGEKRMMDEVEVKREDISQSVIEEGTIEERPRPPLRAKGFTHFIHVPFLKALEDVYNNQISPLIEEEDRDLLQPLETMHMTVMVFRLKHEDDLPRWSQVLRSAKKARANVKGVNIFPIKKNYSRVLYLNIKGLEDLIDRIVGKAIELDLITESQLSHIRFDKVSETYKAEHPHISLLRTKGDDIFDFTQYLKVLKDVNLSKINISQIRLSMIGSFDGQDYYNEDIHKL